MTDPLDDDQHLADALALYRSMSDRELTLFRAALVLDSRPGAPADTVRFCQRRVDLIDLVLRSRAGVDEGGPPQ